MYILYEFGLKREKVNVINYCL